MSNAMDMHKMLDEFNKSVFEKKWLEFPHKKNVKKSYAYKCICNSYITYINKMMNCGQKIDPSQCETFADVSDYVLYFINYHTECMNEETKAKFFTIDNFYKELLNEVTENLKLHLLIGMKNITETNAFSPEMVILDLLSNFNLNTLYRYKQILDKDNRSIKLSRLFTKAFQWIKNAIRVMESGQSTDALAIWRIAHELECVIIILNKYDQVLINKYFENAKYLPLEFANEEDIEFSDLGAELEEERKNYKAKCSKNGFINYGWLLAIPEFRAKKINLAFNNSVQHLSGQSKRYSSYKKACKFVHQSPASLIVDQREVYYLAWEELCVTLTNLTNEMVTFIEFFNESNGGNVVGDYRKATVNYFNQLNAYRKKQFSKMRLYNNLTP